MLFTDLAGSTVQDIVIHCRFLFCVQRFLLVNKITVVILLVKIWLNTLSLWNKVEVIKTGFHLAELVKFIELFGNLG